MSGGRDRPQSTLQEGRHHPRRPLDLSSSPPWFPAGPEHQTQWARHRKQRRNSAGYTFTDLAEIVCRNIKDSDDDVVAPAERYSGLSYNQASKYVISASLLFTQILS